MANRHSKNLCWCSVVQSWWWLLVDQDASLMNREQPAGTTILDWWTVTFPTWWILVPNDHWRWLMTHLKAESLRLLPWGIWNSLSIALEFALFALSQGRMLQPSSQLWRPSSGQEISQHHGPVMLQLCENSTCAASHAKILQTCATWAMSSACTEPLIVDWWCRMINKWMRS